jgi:hypothetical protein
MRKRPGKPKLGDTGQNNQHYSNVSRTCKREKEGETDMAWTRLKRKNKQESWVGS